MNPSEYYILFDLKVQSNIPLNIPKTDVCVPDVIINVSGWNPPVSDEDSVEFSINGLNDITVDMYDMAKFTIQDGNSIHVIPHKKDYWNNELVTYIVGVAFATLLLQRNIFSIHGSAVCINDLAFVIVGEGGAGKSSLAREFIQSGYKLLSDDLSAISTDNQLYVIPSFPVQKMWEDTMEVFKASPDQNRKIFQNANKFYVDIQDSFESISKQLGAIIWLEETETEKVCINKISKGQALEVLLKHAYIEDMVEQLGLKGQQFILLSYILNFVDVYYLERPKDAFTVKEQVRVINENLVNYKTM